MVQCNKCSRKLNKKDYQILCNKCKIWYCSGCSSMSNKMIKEYADDARDWICRGCSNVRLSVNIPGTFVDEEEAPEEYGKESEEGGDNLTLSDVVQMIRELGLKIEAMKNENENLVRLLTKKDAELDEHKRKIDVLEYNVDCLEQERRSSSVVVRNIPKIDGENCYKVVKDIASLIGIEYEDGGEPFTAYRVSKKMHSPIVVKYKNKADKMDLMEKIKRKGGLTLDELKFTDYNIKYNKVYVNHDMTPYRRDLLSKSKAVQKRLEYKYLWIVDGDIFVRKNDGAKRLQIRCEQDLLKLE